MTSSACIASVFKGAPSECSCERCVAMCERTPCLATPQDILRLINAGLKDYLTPTTWMAGDVFGLIPPIEMIQINVNAETPLDPTPCPFLCAGLCQLHGRSLKPAEGSLSSCRHHVSLEESPTMGVALTWLLKRNERLVAHLFALFEPPKNTTPILL